MLVKKITEGYVVQIFDTDTKECIEQKFVPEDVVYFEDEYGNHVDQSLLTDDGGHEVYYPFDMWQPLTKDNYVV